MSLINAEVEWYGSDFAEGHIDLNGKPFKVILESEE